MAKTVVTEEVLQSINAIKAASLKAHQEIKNAASKMVADINNLEAKNIELRTQLQLKQYAQQKQQKEQQIKAEQAALNKLLRQQLDNFNTIEKIAVEQQMRTERAQAKAEGDVLQKKLHNEQLVTDLKSASLLRHEKAEADSMEKLLTQAKANAETTTAIETEQLHRIARAKATAQGQLLTQQKANEETITAIQAEQLQRDERAKANSEGKLLKLKESNEKTLTAIATAQNETIAHAKEQVQKKLNDAELAHIEAVNALRLAGIQQEEQAFARNRSQVDELRTAIANIQQELFAEQQKREGSINMIAKEAAGRGLKDYSEKQRDLNKQKNEALFKEGIVDPNSKEANKAMARVETETALAAQAKQAEESFKAMFGAGDKLVFNWHEMGKAMTGFHIGLDGASHSLATYKKDMANLTADQKATASKKKKELTAAQRNVKKGKATTAEQEQLKAFAEYKDLKAKLATSTDDKDRAEIQAKIDAQLKTMNISAEEANAVDMMNEKSASIANAIGNMTAGLSSIAKQLEKTIDEIAVQQGAINTRLNGLEGKGSKNWYSKITGDFSALMASPLIREEALMKNALSVIDRGIARDVEQFAMLETIKDKIATTFNTFDGTMLRLIRIQDYNTSAARMGMEASLNAFLNNMYETTEYLSDVAASVRSSLEEAEALMGGQTAVEFEYQVQKWMGSMYSVGMSNKAVQGIATALGQFAAGEIEGIANGGIGNLLVMAANNANISIADALAEGLDSSKTNTLLNSMVSYMKDLVDEANGNKVVQQQLAKVFGVSASDLKAAVNLLGEYQGKENIAQTIYGKNSTNSGADIYNSLLTTLGEEASKMYSRISVGEIMENVMANVKYSTSAGIASNPALYGMMKTADILDTFAGGLPIPFVLGAGFGADLKLKVSDIMRTASLATGFTSSLVKAIGAAFKGGGGFTGNGLLKMVGIDTKVSRTEDSSSGSGTIVNGNVEDMTESASNEGSGKAKKQKVKAKEEANDDVDNKVLNESILSIYDLLQAVIDGSNSMHVVVDNSADFKVGDVTGAGAMGTSQFA